MADNKYFQAEPLVQDVAKALEVGRTPYTLTFFEQINSPQGPWLQMLQRAYYTDDDLDKVIADAKEAMKEISCQSRTGATPPPRGAATVRPSRRGPHVSGPGGRAARPTRAPTLTMLAIRRRPACRTTLESHAGDAPQQADRAPVPQPRRCCSCWPSRPTRSIQMVWMSFNSWSLITPPKFIGTGNFTRAFSDNQFWMSLDLQPQVHAVHHADPDGRRLPAGPAGRAQLAAPAGHPRPSCSSRSSSASACRACCGTGCSARTFGLIDTALMDLGLIDKPVLWLGTDADTSTWAIIGSVTWKVIGFGMLLFVAAIQAIPHEINEAAIVDGASYWQRVRRVTVPLTAPTILLVTLISVIGSLLAFDQFYIMTAGQPFNQTATAVFYIYLNSFPYLKLGYGAALSLLIAGVVLLFTVVQLTLTRRSRR